MKFEPTMSSYVGTWQLQRASQAQSACQLHNKLCGAKQWHTYFAYRVFQKK